MRVYKSLGELPSFEKSVVTIGSFDGVHLGHQKLISRMTSMAKELALPDILVTFYPHPRSIIYPKDDTLKLLNTIEEKIAIFESLGVSNLVIVPFTFEFSQMSPREYVERFLMQSFNPHTIIIGYDHRFGFNRQGDISLLRQYEADGKFNIVEVPKQEIDEITISSTKIRKALLSGNIEEANLYLGGYYPIEGQVVKGDSIGEKIGYPTANIQPSIHNKLTPVDGVYAVYVWIDKVRYEGMLYIGPRPTLGEKLQKTIEVNIFDFSGSLYHDRIKVEIVSHLRGDEKFDSLDLLKNQLLLDRSNAVVALANERQKVVSKPRCTIAILNYNGEEYLEANLASMLNSGDECPFEVCVIDNNSSDESVSYISEWHPEVKVVQLSKNYGFTGGYNKGLEGIETEYVALVNSDVMADSNWLDRIIKIMDADKSIAAMQPKIKSLEERNKFEYAGAAGGYLDLLAYPFCRGRIFDTVEVDQGQYNSVEEVFWTSGAAMVIRTDLYKKFKGFDESYFAHMEEIDLCWRLKKAGYKCMVHAGVHVYHLGGGTLDYESPRKVYLNFRNNIITILKNESKRFVFFTFFLRLILDGVAGLKYLVEGKWKSTLSIVKAHFAVYLNIFSILESRSYYNGLIAKHRIGKRNMKGRFNRFIILDYFVGGLKTFDKLKRNYL